MTPHDITPVFDGPLHIASQLRAAGRLAPAQAFRGQTGVLLYCGDPAGLDAALDAFRESWGLDAVYAIRCPVDSWSQAFEQASGATPWLKHWVLRQVEPLDPTVVAVLDPDAKNGAGGGQPLIALLEEWGAPGPLVLVNGGAALPAAPF